MAETSVQMEKEANHSSLPGHLDVTEAKVGLTPHSVFLVQTNTLDFPPSIFSQQLLPLELMGPHTPPFPQNPTYIV